MALAVCVIISTRGLIGCVCGGGGGGGGEGISLPPPPWNLGFSMGNITQCNIHVNANEHNTVTNGTTSTAILLSFLFHIYTMFSKSQSVCPFGWRIDGNFHVYM